MYAPSVDFSLKAYIKSGLFASDQAALVACDSDAAAAGAVAVLDYDITLTANTALTATWRKFGGGGVITRGTYTLSGDFWAPSRTQIFDAAGTGLITLTAPASLSPYWFGALGFGISDDTNPWQSCIASAIASQYQPSIASPPGRFLVKQTSSNPTIFDLNLTSGDLTQGIQFSGAGISSTIFIIGGTLTGARYLPTTETQFNDYTTYPESSRSAFIRLPTSSGSCFKDFSVVLQNPGVNSANDVCYGIRLGGIASPGGVCQRGLVQNVSMQCGYASLMAGADPVNDSGDRADVYGWTYLDCVFVSSYGSLNGSIGAGGVCRFYNSQTVQHVFINSTLQISGNNNKDALIQLMYGASDIKAIETVMLPYTGGAWARDQYCWWFNSYGLSGQTGIMQGGLALGPWAFADQNDAYLSQFFMDGVQCQFANYMGANIVGLNWSNGGAASIKRCYPVGSWTSTIEHYIANANITGLTASSPVKSWNPYGLNLYGATQPLLTWEDNGASLCDNMYYGPTQSGGTNPFRYRGDTLNTWESEQRIQDLLASSNPALEKQLYQVSFYNTGGAVIANPTTNISWSGGGSSQYKPAAKPATYATATTVQLSAFCQVTELETFHLALDWIATGLAVPTGATSFSDSDYITLTFNFLGGGGTSIGVAGVGQFAYMLNPGTFTAAQFASTFTGWASGMAIMPGEINIWNRFFTPPIVAPTNSAVLRLDVNLVMQNSANTSAYDIAWLVPQAFVGPYLGRVRHDPLQSFLIAPVADTPPTAATYGIGAGTVIWNEKSIASGKIPAWIYDSAGAAHAMAALTS